MADRLLNHRLAVFDFTPSFVDIECNWIDGYRLVRAHPRVSLDDGRPRRNSVPGHDYVQYVNDTSETLTLTVCMNSCIGEDPTFELPPGQKFLTSERGPRPAFSDARNNPRG